MASIVRWIELSLSRAAPISEEVATPKCPCQHAQGTLARSTSGVVWARKAYRPEPHTIQSATRPLIAPSAGL